MTRAFLITALLLATTPAHAECCDDMPSYEYAGRAFDVAAKRQFGRGVFSVGIYTRRSVSEYCNNNGLAVGFQSVEDCIRQQAQGAVLEIKNARYLGVDEQGYTNGMYLMCSYRTKPRIRFLKCYAWEGE
jgi:hypothetical protein